MPIQSISTETSLTLTVTRRLALRIQQALLQGKRPQAAQAIYALNDWYHNLWEQCQARGLTGELTLLTPIQEHALWLSIIEQNEYGVGLLKPQQTAKQLMTTFKLIAQWQLDIHTIDWGNHEESLIFKEWANSFLNLCEQRSLVSASLLPDRLKEILFDHPTVFGRLVPAKNINLTGFDDYPPQLKSWLEALQSVGKLIEYPKINVAPKSIERYEFIDLNHELSHVAKDAKEWVQNHDGVYAIVVPELVQIRSQIEQVFNEVCDPQAILNPEFAVSWQYNISAGLSLVEYPILNAALLSLTLLHSKITLENLIALLHSPFFKASRLENTARLHFVHTLKQREQIHFKLNELLKLDFNGLEEFKLILEAAKQFKEKMKSKQWIVTWQKHLLEWFDVIDWPGDRRLNSVEFQVVQRFYAAMKEWCQLDSVGEKLNWSTALGWLKNLMFETSFQPESNPVRIQIMGLLEASGQQFDKLWVIGLNSEVWPASPSPNPFLPMDLQRKENMPHASSQRELVFAQHLTNTLTQSAQEVVFSHANQIDGKEYQPSPLIMDYKAIQSNEPLPQTLEQKIFQSRQTEERLKESPIPLTPEETIFGGTSIIQDQSYCPFKAFATHRLKTREPGMQEEGISALERGNMLHQALQHVWEQLVDHQTLSQFPQEELDQLVENVILNLDDQILATKQFYWAIEKQRLKMLILSWLELEKQRKPFKVVKTEVNVQVKLKGMTLNCWLDRVDITDDGQPIIIDYKTGNVALKSCFGERPDSPQLPLYCFSNFPANPKGIVYAIVRRDGCQFLGVSEEAGLLPNVGDVSALKLDEAPKDWAHLIDHWKSILDGLSEEFSHGLHEVAPSSAKACLYCDLQGLCRVMEHQNG